MELLTLMDAHRNKLYGARTGTSIHGRIRNCGTKYFDQIKTEFGNRFSQCSERYTSQRDRVTTRSNKSFMAWIIVPRQVLWFGEKRKEKATYVQRKIQPLAMHRLLLVPEQPRMSVPFASVQWESVFVDLQQLISTVIVGSRTLCFRKLFNMHHQRSDHHRTTTRTLHSCLSLVWPNQIFIWTAPPFYLGCLTRSHLTLGLDCFGARYLWPYKKVTVRCYIVWCILMN